MQGEFLVTSGAGSVQILSAGLNAGEHVLNRYVNAKPSQMIGTCLSFLQVRVQPSKLGETHWEFGGTSDDR